MSVSDSSVVKQFRQVVVRATKVSVHAQVSNRAALAVEEAVAGQS